MDPMWSETRWSNFKRVPFRLLYNKILTSMTIIIECTSWLMNVTESVEIHVKLKNDVSFSWTVILKFHYTFMVGASPGFDHEEYCPVGGESI